MKPIDEVGFRVSLNALYFNKSRIETEMVLHSFNNLLRAVKRMRGDVIVFNAMRQRNAWNVFDIHVSWNRVYGAWGNMSNISSYTPPVIFS